MAEDAKGWKRVLRERRGGPKPLTSLVVTLANEQSEWLEAECARTGEGPHDVIRRPVAEARAKAPMRTGLPKSG